MKDYKETILNKKESIREFDAAIVEEYEWHRDKEDRIVTVIEAGSGWCYQEDNCLPVLLSEGCVINIEKLVFHRLIKGVGKLVVKVSKK